MKILMIGLLMLTLTISSAKDISKELKEVNDTVQDMDGNVYRTVKIGDKTWLAENLRTTTFQDGTKVNTGFVPDDDESKLLSNGRLYDWHDATNERDICPTGSRVASDDDWKALEKTIGIAESELDNTGWRGKK